ncbi:MAG TPA: hypothetical protein VKD26_07890 [Streptosporangiaceae bacterium]|nr:hypothetical protein [Streptosporangiaceae bacterium]
MTGTHDCRAPHRGRAVAAAALAGPLIALFCQLWPAAARAAVEPAPGSAPQKVVLGPHQGVAARVAAARPAALARRVSFPAASPSGHPAGSAPSPAGSRSPATAPTPASGPDHPQLSIGVDDGRRAVHAGDILTYTIKIHNIGTTDAKRLQIVQTLPAGLKLISATQPGVTHAAQVTWRVNLPAGGAGTFGVVGRVGQTPRQLLRLATIACATVGGGVRPLVCAAHSDELPAGAMAARGRHAASGGAGGATGFLLPAGLALVLCAAAAIGGRWLLLRRRARREP